MFDAAQEKGFSGPALVLAFVGYLRLHGVYRLCLGRRFVFGQQIPQCHDLRHEVQILLGPLFVGERLPHLLLAPMHAPGVVDVPQEREIGAVDAQLEPRCPCQRVKRSLHLLINRGPGIKALHFFPYRKGGRRFHDVERKHTVPVQLYFVIENLVAVLEVGPVLRTNFVQAVPVDADDLVFE